MYTFVATDLYKTQRNLDYDENIDPESFQGGISGEHAILIENTFPSIGSDKAQSYSRLDPGNIVYRSNGP